MIKKRNKKIDTLAPKIATAQFMFYVNALIWFGFGIYIFVEMLKAGNFASTIFFISFFLLINVGAMVFCAITIGRRDAWAYYFSIFIIVLNGFFTGASEFEAFNIIAFVIDVIIFVFLLTIGRAYLAQATK